MANCKWSISVLLLYSPLNSCFLVYLQDNCNSTSAETHEIPAFFPTSHHIAYPPHKSHGKRGWFASWAPYLSPSSTHTKHNVSTLLLICGIYSWLSSIYRRTIVPIAGPCNSARTKSSEKPNLDVLRGHEHTDWPSSSAAAVEHHPPPTRNYPEAIYGPIQHLKETLVVRPELKPLHRNLSACQLKLS